jgi:hypothetical protein
LLNTVEVDVVVVSEQSSANLPGRVPNTLHGGLISLGQLGADLQGGDEDRQGSGVEQVIQMCTAGIDAPVATVLKKHASKFEYRLDELSVSIGSESGINKLGLVPLFIVAMVGFRGAVEEDLAAEIARLRSLVEFVGAAKLLQYTVKSVEKRDPVVEITSSEGPSRRKACKPLWQEG